MVHCIVVGCGSKSGKHNVSFHSVPKIVFNQGQQHEELTRERRTRWQPKETQQQRESSKANEFVDFTSFQGLLHRFGINIILTGYQRLTLARKSLAKQATTIKQLNGPRERRKEGSDP